MTTKTRNLMTPVFGQIYTVTGEVRKQRIERQGYRWRGKKPFNTVWITSTFTPLKALYIGRRVVHEGYTNWDGDPDVDGSWEFSRTHSITVYLFVVSERTKPFYVLPNQIYDLVPF